MLHVYFDLKNVPEAMCSVNVNRMCLNDNAKFCKYKNNNKTATKTCLAGTCCCVSGYEGDICQTEILECESSPCGGNGATCVELVDEYYCICPDGKDVNY